MQNIFLTLTFILFSFSTIAAEQNGTRYRHQVMVNNEGFGYGGSIERADTKSSSPFKDVSILHDNLSFNYAYRVSDRIQIGVFYQHQQYKGNLTNKRGGDADIKKNSSHYGLFAQYNFHDDLPKAWYTGVMAAQINDEENVGHEFTEAEAKAPFELDDTGYFFQLYVGKRFSLDKMGINNITYSPKVGLYARTYGKDFRDQGFKGGQGVTFEFIRFDVLF